MKRIIVAVDFTEITSKLIECAKKLAKPTNAKIILIHSENYQIYTDANIMATSVAVSDFKKQKEKDLEQLKKLQAQLSEEKLEVEYFLVEGKVSNEIVAKTEELNADMLIVGSHQHGKFYHLIMGNIHESLISKSTCPVLVIPPDKE